MVCTNYCFFVLSLFNPLQTPLNGSSTAVLPSLVYPDKENTLFGQGKTTEAIFAMC
jgi:hypothetical protein